jgi:hypothetical protein
MYKIIRVVGPYLKYIFHTVDKSYWPTAYDNDSSL